jgi:hypothetical protein
MASSTAARDPRDVATAWFALLEKSREKGDTDREDEARRNLERLGVTVTYHRPRPEAAR